MLPKTLRRSIESEGRSWYCTESRSIDGSRFTHWFSNLRPTKYGFSSRTISIAESARRNAQVRQARMAAQQQQQQSQQQQQPRHGRPPFRRDVNRGRGRGGR
ncbi:hypothetical protein HPP92_016745 [Vanilla planifolia]|uniref:Uncharacterized protein n=1 Tax=Vanilla planifolia TaxID=51239 RepID=A0A835QM28_VANPL|nr:hypothetical protein HPP92_016745 [Vanilla planifolia]